MFMSLQTNSRYSGFQTITVLPDPSDKRGAGKQTYPLGGTTDSAYIVQAAPKEVGRQSVKGPASGKDLSTISTLLGKLMTLLDGFSGVSHVAPDASSAAHKPSVDSAPAPRLDNGLAAEADGWRETLMPYLTRPRQGNGISNFDHGLRELFSDEDNYEPVTEFLSSKAKGEKPNDIRHGLRAAYEMYPWLGRDGREEHVAALKVAMMKFGQSPASLFEEVAATSGGFNITMKDGFKLHITHEELKLGFKAAKFVGADQDLVKDASFLFSVMNKRKQLEDEAANESDPFMQMYAKDSEYHARRTYPGILAGTGNGIGGGDALYYLGMKNHMTIVKAQALGSEMGVPVTRGVREKNGAITGGMMEGQLYNKPVLPSLDVVVLSETTAR
jgi:hypothetical protein